MPIDKKDADRKTSMAKGQLEANTVNAENEWFAAKTAQNK